MKYPIFFLSLTLWLAACTSPTKQPATPPSQPESSAPIVVDVTGGSIKAADGLDIFYQTVEGQAHETTLLFVHGWCIDGGYWDAQLAHFSQKYQVIAVDLPGHGNSGMDRAEWTMEAYAADIQAICESLDLQKVVLVGHSMSEAIVSEAANLMPDRIVGIIGIDNFEEPEPVVPQEEIKMLYQLLEDNFGGSVVEWLGSGVPPAANQPINQAILNDIAKGPAPICTDIFKGMIAYHEAGKFPIALSSVKVPIHTITTIVRTKMDAWQAFGVNITEHHIETPCGHYPMREAPQAFNQLLEEALTQILN